MTKTSCFMGGCARRAACFQDAALALLRAGHVMLAYSARFQALRLCLVLEWKIVSVRMLLREGFYSLKRNLPRGNWVGCFFVFFILLPLHAHDPA